MNWRKAKWWLKRNWRILACGGAIGVGVGITSSYYEIPVGFNFKNFVFYPNCAAARAAGVAPIHSGEPGYRLGLDADRDGVACEPYRSLR